MNTQIELSDEQLDLVLGGVTVSGNGLAIVPVLQGNLTTDVAIPIAISPTLNIVGIGSGNSQHGSTNIPVAFNIPTQSNS